MKSASVSIIALAFVVSLFPSNLEAQQKSPPPIQQPWEGVPPAFQNLPVGQLKIPATLDDWKRERASIKATVLQCLGDIPARPAHLKVRTISTDKKNGYRVEKFVFNNGVDSEVPGYIAIPDNRRGRLPAILTMHGSSSSKDNMFGYDPSSQNVAELLAHHGYVVLGIDNYFAGERRGKGPGGDLETGKFVPTAGIDQELTFFKMNLLLGRTLWGMMLRDEQIALDYLASRPEVDPDRIGAQGMSMGSTRAWWLAAIDDRVKAVVAVACLFRYQDLIATRNLRAHGMHHFTPGLLKHFDTEGIMALIAPRPFLALTGDRDPGSPPEGIKHLETVLKSFYRLYDKPDAFRSVIYPGLGHVYNDDMKEKMVAWFEKFVPPQP